MEFWFRRESQAQRQQQVCCGDVFGDDDDDVVAWVAEKGNGVFTGEDFMVDDLLDLAEFETQEDDDDDDCNNFHHETKQQGEEEIVGGEDTSNKSLEPEVPSYPPSSSFCELSLPTHDGAELEWVSRIVDDSHSEFPTTTNLYHHHHHHHPPAAKTSNLSVLDSHQHQPPPPTMVMMKSKRSKRARASNSSSSSSSSSTTCSNSWGGGAPLLLIDSSPTSSSSCSSPASSHFIVAHSLIDHIPSLSNKQNQNPIMNKNKNKKKRGRRPKAASAAATLVVKGERRCSHCGVNKTPQWRTGPDGTKTLCNACGVRYKSGRLLPEYRPACSPTFITHIHSNSHRRVMEMRRHKEQ